MNYCKDCWKKLQILVRLAEYTDEGIDEEVSQGFRKPLMDRFMIKSSQLKTAGMN